MKRLLIILLLCLVATSAFGQFQQKPILGVPIDPTRQLGDPDAFWLFNEGSGNKVFDLSGNGNTGTITDGVRQAGKFGSTILFNDASTVINFGDILDIRTGDFSYGIWFKTNWLAANEAHSLIAKSRAGSGVARYFLIFQDTELFASLVTSGGVKKIQVPEAPYIDGNWHHAFVTIKRTGNMTLYVDGISVGTVDVSDGVANDLNTTYLLGVGAYQDSSGNIFDRSWFDGLLDIPIFYNRALSASEIALLYREPFGMFVQDDIALLAVEAPAPTGGQVIMIQMSAIPLIAIPLVLITGLCLMMGRKNAA